MDRIPVSEIMTRDVERVAPDAPLSEALQRLRERNLSCVVVCEKGAPVGVISERDVVRAHGTLFSEHSGAVAAGLMATPVVTVEADLDVAAAVKQLRDRSIRRLPVVDGEGLLIGIVTQTDLLDARSHQLEGINEELERRVAARTAEVEALAKRFEALSLEDALMGIGNRRSMEEALERSHETGQRYQRIYSVLLIDVDHFKPYNDTYGHAAGDEALVSVAENLRALMRRADLVFRYGGEEILVLLPETDIEGALRAAIRIVESVSQLGIAHESSPHGRLTVSCGVARVRLSGEADPDEGWQSLVGRADRGLYRAKEAGRNRAILES